MLFFKLMLFYFLCSLSSLTAYVFLTSKNYVWGSLKPRMDVPSSRDALGWIMPGAQALSIRDDLRPGSLAHPGANPFEHLSVAKCLMDYFPIYFFLCQGRLLFNLLVLGNRGWFWIRVCNSLWSQLSMWSLFCKISHAWMPPGPWFLSPL